MLNGAFAGTPHFDARGDAASGTGSVPDGGGEEEGGGVVGDALQANTAYEAHVPSTTGAGQPEYMAAAMPGAGGTDGLRTGGNSSDLLTVVAVARPSHRTYAPVMVGNANPLYVPSQAHMARLVSAAAVPVHAAREQLQEDQRFPLMGPSHGPSAILLPVHPMIVITLRHFMLLKHRGSCKYTEERGLGVVTGLTVLIYRVDVLNRRRM